MNKLPMKSSEVLKAIIRVRVKYGAFPTKEGSVTSESNRRAWLKWSLDLIRHDLNTISEGDWLNLYHEMYAFLFDPLNTNDLIGDPYSEAQFLNSAVLNHLPTKDEIKGFQSKLLRKLSHFLNTGKYEVTGMVTATVIRKRINDDQIGTAFFPITSDYEETAIYSMALLLESQGGLIRRCGECNQLFLADRKDQIFCSIKCTNRATQRRFREKGGTSKRKK